MESSDLKMNNTIKFVEPMIVCMDFTVLLVPHRCRRLVCEWKHL